VIKICVLSESEGRFLAYRGMAYKCSRGRHQHIPRNVADMLVQAGELTWLGKHKRVATYKNARTWMKVYTRNRCGEVDTCGMQLVRGGGGF
jgi:hypothetical protein